MAMIQCPECGQEISDKAKKCIHCGKVLIEEVSATKICSDCGKENSIEATECIYCGCPFEDEKVVEPTSVQKPVEKPKKNLKKIIIPIVAAVLVIAVVIVIYNVKVVQPKKIEAQNKATYEEAVALLDKGKYEEANEIFDTISDYENVSTLQEQLFYESRVFQCIKSIKERLKNPDSLQIYEVVFFSKEYNEGIDATDEMKEALNDLIANEGNEPVVLMRYGAQNGFGGNTTSYAMFVYLNDKYEFLGSCNTLDEDEVDEDDEKICTIINMIKDYFKTTGNVDIDRIKRVLKDDNYTSIKIIE